MKKISLVVIVLTVLAGCVVGPKYQQPVVDVPVQFRDSQYSKATDTIFYLNWWDMFQDTVLQGLIREAVQNNRNIRTTLARVEESRLSLGFTRRASLPSIGYGAKAGYYDLSNGNNNEIGGGLPRASYNLFAQASWEPDFWGKYKNQKLAAEAEMHATEDDYRYMYISLVAETAMQYFLLRDLDERMLIAEQTIKSRESSLGIIKARFEKGEVAEMDKLQAEGQLAIARATYYNLQRNIRTTENALSVLTGKQPGEIRRGYFNHEQKVPPELPVGLPSTLLSQRPDVRAAENMIQAQVARIGIAEAVRYPTFDLMALFGVHSQDISQLFSTNALATVLTAGITGPIFQFGRNKKRVEIEKKRSEQFVLQYEQAILNASKEVQDGLIGIETYKKERENLEILVATTKKTQELSWARYEAGYSSYLELLDAERMQFDAANNASIIRREQLISLVKLYKALGGGWDKNLNF
ncbi:MAG: efflux transporter outer membrane subunit [Sphingobacteriales bacterium]|jgi:multidrug efflux system outer membrane protein